jgi:apolipoprotein N-acyltransferase
VRFSSVWRPLAGIATSALLFGLYARLGEHAWPLGFVALVPWLLTLDAARSAKTALLGALAMSVAFVAAVFGWFGPAIAGYLGLPSAAGLLPLLLLAPLLQPQFLVFALVRRFAARRHGRRVAALAAAAAWVAAEWLLPRLFGDTLGHGLHPSRTLRQLAEFGGAAGLTFLLLLVNDSVAASIARRREGARASLEPLAIGAAIVAAMAAIGAWRLQTLADRAPADVPPLRVGLVQANIVDYERLRREMGGTGAVVRHLLDTHYAMSQEAVRGHRVDALLWPETVYPTTFGQPKSEAGAELDREIRGFVDYIGVPLVFGTYDRDAAGEYNAAAFVEPQRGLLGAYRKSRPFPLTEYVPGWLDGPTLRRLLPWAGTWVPGDGARVLPLRLVDGREVPALPMICLDATDPDLALDGARLGAQVILGLSNDSWFTRHPQGARLHLAVAAFRSIETRLPQLRATNNGISAVIDAGGDVVAATEMDEQRLLIGEVTPASPAPTRMVAWGDWVGRAALVLLALLLGGPALLAGLSRFARRPVQAEAMQAPYRAEAIVLPRAWRIAAAALRVFARGSLLWIAAAVLLSTDVQQIDALQKIRMTVALFLAPELAAWAIGRAHAALLRVDEGMLTIEQGARRIEIPLREIVALLPWTLPLPQSGVWLELGSGRRWSQGIALADPEALMRALAAAGATLAPPTGADARAMTWARASAAVGRRRADHPLSKFVLFPLVPALPVFRLHQHIAYGGTFGEWQTFGAQAWFSALGLWWASWAVNLLLFAAVLRVAIESIALITLALRPVRAIEIRRVLEPLGRLLFYLGVPLWLAVRLLSG